MHHAPLSMFCLPFHGAGVDVNTTHWGLISASIPSQYALEGTLGRRNGLPDVCLVYLTSIYCCSI